MSKSYQSSEAGGGDLIQPHGGFRHLKSFCLAQLAYDVTVRFCDNYIDRRSRTHDQMVQAARSGVQNIGEGSVASATSKKFELKLTKVARASLEELKLDYEDFLRHRGLPKLKPNHPALMRFKQQKPQTVEEFAAWVNTERTLPNADGEVLSSSCLAANGALSLLNVACYLLDRQVAHLAQKFEDEGGFTERLYKIRQAKRLSEKHGHTD
ncbi:MAG: four helix bundle suffix domain-containing protein [Thermoguttaceae bacterium]